MLGEETFLSCFFYCFVSGLRLAGMFGRLNLIAWKATEHHKSCFMLGWLGFREWDFSNVDPEILQSGFGVSFYLGRRILGKLPANFRNEL